MIDTSLRSHHPRALLKGLLVKLGYNVRIDRSVGLINLQIRRRKAAPPPAPALLVDDPLEALHLNRGGKPAAFRCPIDGCVTVNGLNFARSGWHPFSATLEERAALNGELEYDDSLLKRFYARWQPANAQEAFLMPDIAPPSFKELPPHLLYLFPWSARSVAEADRAVQKWTQDDHLEHSGPAVATMSGALKDQGPIADHVARFEFERLTTLHDRLRAEGFRRERGDIRVLLLKRGAELRFLNFGGGLHRTAAMKALGHTYIPAMPLNQMIIDVDDIDYWPQVRGGVWSRTQAMKYIDHLFEFDARHWAQQQGFPV